MAVVPDCPVVLEGEGTEFAEDVLVEGFAGGWGGGGGVAVLYGAFVVDVDAGDGAHFCDVW